MTTTLLNAYSIRVPSPDGTVIVHCTEDTRGRLSHIIINMGKAGLSAASWSDALSRMINLALKNTDLNLILAELSNITSGKSVFHPDHQNVKSAPDAVYRALLMYRNLKKETLVEANLPRLTIPSDW
jgi:hypothetical protein